MVIRIIFYSWWSNEAINLSFNSFQRAIGSYIYIVNWGGFVLSEISKSLVRKYPPTRYPCLRQSYSTSNSLKFHFMFIWLLNTLLSGPISWHDSIGTLAFLSLSTYLWSSLASIKSSISLCNFWMNSFLVSSFHYSTAES